MSYTTVGACNVRPYVVVLKRNTSSGIPHFNTFRLGGDDDDSIVPAWTSDMFTMCDNSSILEYTLLLIFSNKSANGEIYVIDDGTVVPLV